MDMTVVANLMHADVYLDITNRRFNINTSK